MQYLPDTNILIRAFNGLEAESELLNNIIQAESLFISAVVVAEVLSQANVSELTSLEKLLKIFPVLIIDENTARLAAKYRKESFKTKRVHMLDCFLAAQAKLNNLVLVTNNKADFPMEDVRIMIP